MNRLTRFFFINSILGLFCLTWAIVSAYLQNPAGFQLWGATNIQRLPIAALALLTVLCGGATIIFWVKPAWNTKALQALADLPERPGIRELILASSVEAILVGSILLLYLLILGEERAGTLLASSIPVIILMFALPIQVIGLEAFKGERRRWITILFILLACAIAGIWFQTFLLGHLERPILIGLRERIVAQAVSALVMLVFLVEVTKLPKQERFFWILIAGLVAGLFLLQWVTFPSKLWRIKPVMALYVPAFVFGLPLIAKASMEIWDRLVAKTNDKAIRVAKIASIIVLLMLAFFYYQAAIKHMKTVNKKINSSDQAFYIEFIKDVSRSNFTSTGDHNRMPLYPYLQALFYRSGMTDKELFAQGKQLNIVLSLALLVLLFLLFLKRMRFFHAVLLILILAFSLYIFKAPYLQVEILFFTLAAISFILMLEMLFHPTWLLAILTGGSVGLTYLTKGTVLPSLYLFLIVYGIRVVVLLWQGLKAKEPTTLRKTTVQLGYLVILVAVFTIIVYPYIREMKLRFGQYFYNVNTTFYIWLDSYDQALEEEAKNHYAESWPVHLSEDQIPSLRRYLNEHTPQQILGRFLIGFRQELQNLYRQFNVINYPLSYLLIFLLAILCDVRNCLRTARNYPYLVLFTMLYFAGYMVAFSWYYPIAGGRRFIYGLYIPFLYVVVLSINELARRQTLFLGQKWNQVNLAKLFVASNIIIALTLVYNIWLVTTEVLFFGRYGS